MTAHQTIDRAVEVIIRGGVLIYPTETLYAVGANALNEQAVRRTAGIKGRPSHKPLPVIIGSLEQLRLICPRVTAEVEALTADFWPGPLSIVLPAGKGLSPCVQDPGGRISVRWSPHPTARELCTRSGVPLVATSANPAGGRAVARPEDLDPGLVAAVDWVYAEPPFPVGGPPSTVVRIVSSSRLRVIREGAVPAARLQAAGWALDLERPDGRG